jgi:hypothetical protein
MAADQGISIAVRGASVRADLGEAADAYFGALPRAMGAVAPGEV